MPVPLRSRSQWMFWAPRFPQTGICLELVVRNSFCLKLEQLEIMFIWCVASRVKRWGFQKQHNSRGSAGSPIITYLSWETSFKPPLVPWSSYHGYVDGMTPFKDDHEIQNTTGHLQSTVRKSSRFCRPSKRTRTPGLCPRGRLPQGDQGPAGDPGTVFRASMATTGEKFCPFSWARRSEEPRRERPEGI